MAKIAECGLHKVGEKLILAKISEQGLPIENEVIVGNLVTTERRYRKIRTNQFVRFKNAHYKTSYTAAQVSPYIKTTPRPAPRVTLELQPPH